MCVTGTSRGPSIQGETEGFAKIIAERASGQILGAAIVGAQACELIGEIQDEQDVDEVPPIVREQDGSFAVDGRMTLDVAARELGLLLPDVPAGVGPSIAMLP